jgi:hypothetical protein
VICREGGELRRHLALDGLELRAFIVELQTP